MLFLSHGHKKTSREKEVKKPGRQPERLAVCRCCRTFLNCHLSLLLRYTFFPFGSRCFGEKFIIILVKYLIRCEGYIPKNPLCGGASGTI